MDLNFEYHQDVVIDGHPCVLNFVENILKPDHILIRRHFISGDHKFRTFRDQILPLTQKPLPEPVVIASVVNQAIPVAGRLSPRLPNPVPVAPPPDEDTAPAVAPDKPGFLSRVMGRGKAKKTGRK